MARTAPDAVRRVGTIARRFGATQTQREPRRCRGSLFSVRWRSTCGLSFIMRTSAIPLVVLLLFASGCGTETIVEPPPSATLRVYPTRALLRAGDSLQLV